MYRLRMKIANDIATEMHSMDRSNWGAAHRKKLKDVLQSDSKRIMFTATKAGAVNVGIIKNKNARRFSFL